MHFATRATHLYAQFVSRPTALAPLFVALALLFSCRMLHGQQAPPPQPNQQEQQEQQEPATTIKKDVNVVNVLATVRNKQGQIVTTLNKDDFKLEADGHPQTIRYFSRVTDTPLTLGLLVDTSLSQRRLLDKERTASYTFLNDMLDQTKDKACVVHFDFEIELLQDLTSSRPKLEAALQKLEVPEPRQMQTGGSDPGQGQMHGGGTKLYDAVFLASDEITSKQQGRKALIILSDGVDQGSKVSLPRAIEAAQRADTLVYTILFADPEAYNNMAGGYPGGGYPGGGYPGGGYPGGGGGGGYPGGGGGGGRGRGGYSHADGKQVMQQLAQLTGGRFFEVSKHESIDDIYKTIGEELRNQYSLGFTPDQADAESGYHKLTVTTTQKDLTVQARDGYYSGKQ
ncbi:MAG TPA: VWA domain-containing protein [Candidatus Eisenbacteria bacterium]|nr:VWA domain-containing protein [Candidatus Eisenbacteria bacterium]